MDDLKFMQIIHHFIVELAEWPRVKSRQKKLEGKT